MARAPAAYRTNDEDFYDAIEVNDADSVPHPRPARFGLLVVAALLLATSFGAAIAALG